MKYMVGFTLAIIVATQGIQASSKVAARQPKGKNVVCITMPKCGTHLLLKCLGLLGIPRLRVGYDLTNPKSIMPGLPLFNLYDSLNKFDPPYHFRGRLDPMTMGPLPEMLKKQMTKISRSDIRSSHWPYTKAAAEFIQPRSRANFFVIRDPRAMLVSMAFMVSKGWRGEVADPKPIMESFIDGRKTSFIRWGVTVHESYPLLWEYGVVDFYKMYLPWMKARNFYTVRFEALVGSRGGGDDAVQYEEIYKIAKHVGVTLSPEKIKQVVEELFGGSTTFREGSIDGWKKHFTLEMKEAFKKVPGANQLLIDLGYETNNSW